MNTIKSNSHTASSNSRGVIKSIVRASLTLVIAFGPVSSVSSKEPLLFDEEIGHYRDLSYDALTDEGLSWEERTRLFGGETVHYGELTAEQRQAKEKELQNRLEKIDMKLVNQCKVDIREWFDQQAEKIPSAYSGIDIYNVRFGAAAFFRAYEIFGDREYLDAGLVCANLILKAQWPKGHWPWGTYGEDFVRIQDGYNDWPFWIMLYAHKLTGDKKYFDSARRCADILHSLQRSSGGWPDQWTFSGRRTGHTGVRNGVSFNDNATNAAFQMMVVMYHMTKDKKYIAKLSNLGPFIIATNLGEGNVVGWAEQYNDNGTPARARGYEIELPYPRTLTRAVGPLLIWLYLMTGDEAHIALIKKAYAWHEHVRQKELDPKQLEAWKLMAESWTKAGKPMHYRPGWPDAWLPDGSNWGRVTGYKMIPWNPVTLEMKKKYGGIIHSSEADVGAWPGNCGYLLKWADDIRAGGKHPECSLGFSHAARGNSLVQVRRALLEYKRGGHKRLLRYYTNPTKFTSDQYLQARVEAAKRALDERNVRLAADPEKKGFVSLKDPRGLISQKGRWYGAKLTKWGAAFNTTGQWGSVAWYQWQLIYDTMLAQGKISAEDAVHGGRGLETVASQTHLDSWDVLGEWGMHTPEMENYFNVPLEEK